MNPSIRDSEVFPDDFIAYRKDRPSLGGGVFVLVHCSLRSSALDIGHEKLESVWCSIRLEDNSSFAVWAFYRPPASDISSLQLLHETISEISGEIFLLAGDFNLPDMLWDDGACTCKTGSRINSEMKNIVNAFGLYQYVHQPTRNGNILDLMFCNVPTIVTSVDNVPGISDHTAVVASIKFEKNKAKKKPTRKVFLFGKGDYSAMSQALSNHLPVFECLAEYSTTQELWCAFKSKVMELVDIYIPSVHSHGMKSRKKPWVTSQLLKIIKNRQRVYRSFKRTKTKKHFDRLSALTREYKVMAKNAKAGYLNRLNEEMKTNPKMFWRYLNVAGRMLPVLTKSNIIIKCSRKI